MMNILKTIHDLRGAGYDPANHLANLSDGNEREARIRELIDMNDKLASALQGITSNMAHMILAFNGLMDSWWDELAPEVTEVIIPDEVKANIMQEIKEAPNDDDTL